ncbi:MAG TPA: isoprenylcysteine carboxylmethyltransferase family protein [Alloacidobacterium sp.]|nr:isoprenylcysteine carboxylmethyltransferase family protein [Alloacidobacterium sp.]
MHYSDFFSSVASLRMLTGYLWLALAIVWLLSAFAAKPTMVRQSSKARFWYLFILAVGAYLIFSRHVDVPWLNIALFRVNIAVAVAGLAIVCLGIAFAIWARLTLGGNWSGAVTIKLDHTLVQHGPYRIVRHPIYTGLLISLAGTALQYGYLRSFLGVLIAGFGFWLKSLIEEQFMAQRFGNEYLAYRQRVRALVPFIF